MESSAVSARIRLTYPICPSRHFPSHQSPFLFPSSHSLSLKVFSLFYFPILLLHSVIFPNSFSLNLQLSQNHFPLTSFNLLEAPSPLKPSATLSDSYRYFLLLFIIIFFFILTLPLINRNSIGTEQGNM